MFQAMFDPEALTGVRLKVKLVPVEVVPPLVPAITPPAVTVTPDALLVGVKSVDKGMPF